MPAASIVNGCTGVLRTATDSQIRDYISLGRSGAEPALDAERLAASTIGTRLHCCEFWMPGGCNLRCQHCYVATWDKQPSLTSAEYRDLTLNLVSQGLVDVVVPGMEPLLREELWAVLNAAESAGARSVGITTNATLLGRHASRLAESCLTVLNVSVDGPPAIHDHIRGRGVFDRVDSGIRAFRKHSFIRLITNTTVNALNHRSLIDIAKQGTEWGVTYSAFHPFEFADEARNELALSAEATADAYELLIAAFVDRRIGSVVLEAEASTLDVIAHLADRGIFDSFELVVDEAGFLFLRIHSREHEMLINLMFQPHHFIRTIRVSDNGGLASCRSMARTGWTGLGDLRTNSLKAHLSDIRVRAALATIWEEYSAAVSRCGLGVFENFLSMLQGKAAAEGQTVDRPSIHACAT